MKTVPTKKSVKQYIDGLEDETRKKDARILVKLMREITGESPKMWGDSIVGFGSYHYKYDSGREGDMPRVGFAPRKRESVVYIVDGFGGYAPLLKKLGKVKTGKSCLYVKRLDDIDLDALEALIRASVAYMDEKYPE